MDLDYHDVMPVNEKRPIWSINRVKQWKKIKRSWFLPVTIDLHLT